MSMAEANAQLMAAARQMVQWGRARQGAWHDASSDLLAALGNRYEAFQELTQQLPPPSEVPSFDTAPAPEPAPWTVPYADASSDWLAAAPGAPVTASAPPVPPTVPAGLSPVPAPPPTTFTPQAAVSPTPPPAPVATAVKKRTFGTTDKVRPRRRLGRLVMAAAAVIVATVASPAVWRAYEEATAVAAPLTNSVTIESNPAGSVVLIDGVESGKTPLTMTLTLGAHDVELRYRKNVRKVALDVMAGEPIVTRVDWVKKPAAKKRAPTRPAAAKTQLGAGDRKPVAAAAPSAAPRTAPQPIDAPTPSQGSAAARETSVQPDPSASTVEPDAR